MLEQPQKLVGRGQVRGVVAGNVAAGPSAASASTVDATCSDSSVRPCTSCSSCTANSTSRNPHCRA
ncbi:glutamate-ammonia-ligase adenylyltransferase domain protein [Mycobacterium xenopi 4042]|uniref:Glutamate-ammonia-ligase adenylyltransferase domain protein n=1 Tax=Mycobacterium xenopi 4042 TaxID=1299334 RepID=X8DC21_MYCXE|nr:glutamate-ammonia-ligase adenylyltransferase domain protein [Mycobacterium xenopi 4042]